MPSPRERNLALGATYPESWRLIGGKPREVAPGTLLQHLQQVDVDGDGRRVLFSLEWHVPDVIELRVYRRGPGTSEGDGRS